VRTSFRGWAALDIDAESAILSASNKQEGDIDEESIIHCACVSMLLAVPARATDLTDAVDAYNTAAAGLEDLYDDFIADQNAAYATFKDMFDALGLYIASDDLEEAEDYWDDHIAAKAQLELNCVMLQDSFFGCFVPAATEAAEMLQDIIDLDEHSSGEVAYVSGSPHFSLAATPFLFWKDEGEPPMDEFLEFDFPQLAVGDPAYYTSYEDETLGDELSSLLDAADWIDLGVWFNKHKDAGKNMNAQLANDYNLLCAYCLCELEIEAEMYLELLEERGYSEGMVDNFCLAFKDQCPDSATAGQKAWAVRQGCMQEGQRPKLVEDLDELKEIIEDYLMIAWYWDYAWEDL